MMKKYKVVVFDLGNVLIPFDYSGAIAKLNKIEAGLGDRFMDYYKSNYNFHRDFERGDISEDDFIAEMLKCVDHKIDRRTFCEYYSQIFTENKKITALLPKLKEKYKLVLMSNTNSVHREYGWKQYEFLANFDKLILSHEVKAVKPEPEIYKAVEAHTKCLPEEHIFIDDIKEYVEGAIRMGWDGIQFISEEQVINELYQKEVI
jgi:glucose-1-phosphatase